MGFSEIWQRVKSTTEIKTFTELANLVGTTSQYISRKKKENDFPVSWAFAIAQKYGVSTDWIMTGAEPKKIQAQNEKKRQLEITNEINAWLQELLEKEPFRKDWFRGNFEDAFPAFKAWKEEKEESEAAKAYTSSRKVA